jgi:hypothetical protein
VFEREIPPGLPPPPPPPPDLGSGDPHGGHGGDTGGGHAGHDAAGGTAGHTGHAAGPGGSHAGHAGEGGGPAQTVTAAKRQRIDRLVVTTTLHSDGSFVVQGRIVGSGRTARAYRVRRVSRRAPAHKLNIVRLKVAKRALRLVDRSLRRHRRMWAQITVTAIDTAGNRSAKTKKIRLLPRKQRGR